MTKGRNYGETREAAPPKRKFRPLSKPKVTRGENSGKYCKRRKKEEILKREEKNFAP